MAVSGFESFDTPSEKAETIWEACYNGDLITVKQLLKLGRSVNAENAELEYPLHLAVHGNRTAVVELLLVHGALVDAIDGKRQTALHIAAEKGYSRIVELLLDSNADLGAFDLKGRTPYDLAKMFERAEVMEALSKAYDFELCPLGCGCVMLHKIIARHVRLDCLAQLVKCPRCALELHGYDLDEHQEYKCWLSRVLCPLGCGGEIYRFDLITHCYQICPNKHVLRTPYEVPLAELLTWTKEEVTNWMVPKLLRLIPKYGLPFDARAAAAASKRRTELQATAYEKRSELGGWHHDDGRFEFGTEEHAVLSLADWMLAWMSDKRIDGARMMQMSAVAYRNFLRAVNTGKKHGWVTKEGKFTLPDWKFEEHADYTDSQRQTFSNQLIDALEHLERKYGGLYRARHEMDGAAAREPDLPAPIDITEILHPSQPAKLAVEYRRIQEMVANQPTAASELTELIEFVFMLVGANAVARRELARDWCQFALPYLQKYIHSVDSCDLSHGDALLRVPLAITCPDGLPVQYSAEFLREYEKIYGCKPPALISAYNVAQGTSPSVYGSDFVIFGDVPVQEMDTLSMLRTKIDQALRDCDNPMIRRVAVGLQPELNLDRFPRPAEWFVRAHWDFTDLVRGGLVVFRDQENVLHPFDIGPLISIRVQQVLCSMSPFEDEHPDSVRDLPDLSAIALED